MRGLLWLGQLSRRWVLIVGGLGSRSWCGGCVVGGVGGAESKAGWGLSRRWSRGVAASRREVAARL